MSQPTYEQLLGILAEPLIVLSVSDITRVHPQRQCDLVCDVKGGTHACSRARQHQESNIKGQSHRSKFKNGHREAIPHL